MATINFTQYKDNFVVTVQELINSNLVEVVWFDTPIIVKDSLGNDIEAFAQLYLPSISTVTPTGNNDADNSTAESVKMPIAFLTMKEELEHAVNYRSTSKKGWVIHKNHMYSVQDAVFKDGGKWLFIEGIRYKFQNKPDSISQQEWFKTLALIVFQITQ